MGERTAPGIVPLKRHCVAGFRLAHRILDIPVADVVSLIGKRVAGALHHQRRYRCNTELHWGVPHHLLNARLIYRELRQMLFGGYVRRCHTGKLLVHFLKDTARL